MSRRPWLAVPVAVLISAATALPPVPAAAEPGGCLKYGAAGAVGGHVAGHHGVLGAAAGCATGAYVRHRYRKKQRQDAAAYRAEHANDPAPGSEGAQPQT